MEKKPITLSPVILLSFLAVLLIGLIFANMVAKNRSKSAGRASDIEKNLEEVFKDSGSETIALGGLTCDRTAHTLDLLVALANYGQETELPGCQGGQVIVDETTINTLYSEIEKQSQDL